MGITVRACKKYERYKGARSLECISGKRTSAKHPVARSHCHRICCIEEMDYMLGRRLCFSSVGLYDPAFIDTHRGGEVEATRS
jgi:hypothetical protein